MESGWERVSALATFDRSQNGLAARHNCITGLDGFELFCAVGLGSCSNKVALGMHVAAVLTRASTSL